MAFGLKIFTKANGSAIITATRDACAIEFFRSAFIAMPRARTTTRKNHERITSFHLYFIRMKMIAKANTNAKIIEMKFGFSSPSADSSPNGSSCSTRICSISPVAGLMIVSVVGA